MKSFITICLILTHYVCGGPFIAVKETAHLIPTIETFSNLYKHTTSFTTSATAQLTQPASRINYNKRFAKRYRKAHRLLKAWLQSNESHAWLCSYKLAQHIQLVNHPFNPWLPAYLSLFAVFEV